MGSSSRWNEVVGTGEMIVRHYTSLVEHLEISVTLSFFHPSHLVPSHFRPKDKIQSSSLSIVGVQSPCHRYAASLKLKDSGLNPAVYLFTLRINLKVTTRCSCHEPTAAEIRSQGMETSSRKFYLSNRGSGVLTCIREISYKHE